MTIGDVYNLTQPLFNYRVFTGNCGKVTYYISGSIAHTIHKFDYFKKGNSVSTSNCHCISFLTGINSLWPPVTSLLPSLRVLPETKLANKTLIQ